MSKRNIKKNMPMEMTNEEKKGKKNSKSPAAILKEENSQDEIENNNLNQANNETKGKKAAKAKPDEAEKKGKKRGKSPKASSKEKTSSDEKADNYLNKSNSKDKDKKTVKLKPDEAEKKGKNRSKSPKASSKEKTSSDEKADNNQNKPNSKDKDKKAAKPKPDKGGKKGKKKGKKGKGDLEKSSENQTIESPEEIKKTLDTSQKEEKSNISEGLQNESQSEKQNQCLVNVGSIMKKNTKNNEQNEKISPTALIVRQKSKKAIAKEAEIEKDPLHQTVTRPKVPKVQIPNKEKLQLKLLELKSEYDQLREKNLPLITESQQLDEEAKPLDVVIKSLMQTRKGLEKELNQLNKQVSEQFSNFSGKLSGTNYTKRTKDKTKPVDITAAIAVKIKEEANLIKMNEMIQQEKCQYQATLKQYDDPHLIENMIVTLEEINLHKKGLEEELAQLKKIFDFHSRCRNIEIKLEATICNLQKDQSELLAVQEKEKKESKENTIDRMGTQQYKASISKITVVRNKKKNAEETSYEQYNRVLSSKGRNDTKESKKENSSQSVGNNGTRLPQLSLFKPEESNILKEIIPKNHLKTFENRFKVIDNDTKKIKKQMNQEKEYFKHTNEKTNQAYQENLARIEQEKKQNKILINDLRKDNNNIKNIKARIKELDKLITITKTNMAILEQQNENFRDTIATIIDVPESEKVNNDDEEVEKKEEKKEEEDQEEEENEDQEEEEDQEIEDQEGEEDQEEEDQEGEDEEELNE